MSFGRAWRIPTFALRFFNVFGPRQSLSNPYTGVAAIFLSRLLNGHAPLVFEDGGQARDFIDVRDIAQAVLMAVESDRAGAHVLNVATHPAHRRRGLARRLLRHVDDVARAEGCRYITLEVRRSNHGAIRLYRKYGFRPVGIRPNYYVEDNEDAIVMLLELQPR